MLAAFPFLERVGGVWCCYRAHLLYSFCAHSVWCFYRAHLLQHPVVILVGARIYYTLPTKDPKLPLPRPPAQPGQAQPGQAACCTHRSKSLSPSSGCMEMFASKEV